MTHYCFLFSVAVIAARWQSDERLADEHPVARYHEGRQPANDDVGDDDSGDGGGGGGVSRLQGPETHRLRETNRKGYFALSLLVY